MGSKNFRSLQDFTRHGANIHLRCAIVHCDHIAIADAWDVWRWARVWRWPSALEADVARHFRCSKCGARRPFMRPTEAEVTLLNFFPLTEQAWEKLIRRARG